MVFMTPLQEDSLPQNFKNFFVFFAGFAVKRILESGRINVL